MTSNGAAEISEPVFMDSHTADRMAMRGPRIRVTSQTERRRRWSLEQKREIVLESFSGAMSASAVARKHDMSPGQLFAWRRQLLAGELGSAAWTPPRFARVDVAAPHRSSDPDQTAHAGPAE